MQDGDASEDSSAPTHSDSRGSKPREPNGIMGNVEHRLVLTFVLNVCAMVHLFVQGCLLPQS